MPIASTRPNNDRTLNEMPAAAITMKLPINDTGMARIGITAARQLCRNTTTTSTTRINASNSVWITASTENWMNSVGLYTTE